MSEVKEKISSITKSKRATKKKRRGVRDKRTKRHKPNESSQKN